MSSAERSSAAKPESKSGRVAVKCEKTPVALDGVWSGFVLASGVAEISPHERRDRLPTAEDWRSFLNQLVTDAAELPGYAPLKFSPSVEVIRGLISCAAGEPVAVVCKRARHTSARRRVLRALGASRERRNFERALRLLRGGINTAQPLALIERRAPPATWLVTRYIPNLVDLDQVALARLARVESLSLRSVKNAIIASVAELCTQIEREGLIHRDLKASNILLEHWDGRDGPVRTILVDLDGLRPPRLWESRHNQRALLRLAASLAEHSWVTPTDRCRFLRAYLRQTSARPREWKGRFRAMQGPVMEYLRRARRRKSQKLDGYAGG